MSPYVCFYVSVVFARACEHAGKLWLRQPGGAALCGTARCCVLTASVPLCVFSVLPL